MVEPSPGELSTPASSTSPLSRHLSLFQTLETWQTLEDCGLGSMGSATVGRTRRIAGRGVGDCLDGRVVVLSPPDFLCPPPYRRLRRCLSHPPSGKVPSQPSSASLRLIRRCPGHRRCSLTALPTTVTERVAGALFSLALEEQNQTVIGVLGAVLPLLRILNIRKVAGIPGAVKGLISVASPDASALSRTALRLMVGMVETKEGKAAILAGGAESEAAVAMGPCRLCS
ncbi:hypothetical protein KSP40_PGU019770 [Platanthera guangdongensis]|uniref:Uncharacterized protein n=1 Tax=Platanthera guangdongensis TaxID=2320717 RepID=A0ABR2MFK6_9ASPA